ncbi:hypothetical protein KR200_009934, partial [Drosophila serrata]
NNQSKFKTIENAVRIGGKGSMRRKYKRVPASAPMEEKRLQTTLNKLSLSPMNGIEKLTLQMEDQSELVITMPQVQGSTGSNLLVVTGTPTHVAPPVEEVESEEPPLLCPSPPPSPPPVPSPSSSFSNIKATKKSKKPRNRLRLRNKHFREMLPEGDGDGDVGEDSDLGSADDLLFGPDYLTQLPDGESDDDSEKTKVPSDGSEMDQTIVGDGSLLELHFGDGDETDDGSWETQDDEEEDEESDKSDEDVNRILDNRDEYDESD